LLAGTRPRSSRRSANDSAGRGIHGLMARGWTQFNVAHRVFSGLKTDLDSSTLMGTGRFWRFTTGARFGQNLIAARQSMQSSGKLSISLHDHYRHAGSRTHRIQRRLAPSGQPLGTYVCLSCANFAVAVGTVLRAKHLATPLKPELLVGVGRRIA